jgi:hypothetical protein
MLASPDLICKATGFLVDYICFFDALYFRNFWGRVCHNSVLGNEKQLRRHGLREEEQHSSKPDKDAIEARDEIQNKYL